MLMYDVEFSENGAKHNFVAFGKQNVSPDSATSEHWGKSKICTLKDNKFTCFKIAIDCNLRILRYPSKKKVKMSSSHSVTKRTGFGEILTSGYRRQGDPIA
jgi:hypothetical protein